MQYVDSSLNSLPYCSEVLFNIETNIKYAGYIENELDRIALVKKLEHIKIPLSFNYDDLQGLSLESKSRLNTVRPETVGQASRISGIRPTDISIIGVYLKRAVSRETL